LPGELGPGDFNSDGKVDMYDFAIFSLDWCKDTAVEPLLNDRTDMDDSGVVNTADLWLFADEWLVGTEIEWSCMVNSFTVHVVFKFSL
jgi:hypothetical protein